MKRLLTLLLAIVASVCAIGIAGCDLFGKVQNVKLSFIVDNQVYATVDTTGSEAITLPSDPEKEGYIFDGWFWDDGVWQKPFTANSLLTAPISSNMKVYAKFSKEHEHIYTSVTTDPTCEAQGYTTHTCDCGHSYIDDYKNALGHDISQHEAKEAKCDEVGWEAYEDCSRCDYTTYNEIAKLEHDISQHEAKEAKCDAVGWEAYEDCSRCDYTTYNEIAKLEHDEENHTAKQPTCGSVGWDAYVTCSRCDYSTYNEIAKLDHTYSIEWENDETYHFHRAICEHIDQVKDKAEHTLDDDNICTVCEYEYYTQELEFRYLDYSQSYQVIGVNGYVYSNNIVIPKTYEEKPVTSIGEGAFASAFGLVGCDAVTIPASITSIGAGAFDGSYSLSKVYFKGTIDDWVMIEFADETANPLYRNVFLDDNNDTDIQIIGPSYRMKDLYIGGEIVSNGYEIVLTKATKIDSYAFIFGFNHLERIILPNQLTTIEADAFSGNRAEIVWGDNPTITTIGNKAFANYLGTSITIPGSVTTIEVGAFYECYSLKSVNFTGTIDDWAMINFGDNPLKIAGRLFINGQIVVQANLTTATKISAGAFWNCIPLISLTIPSSVTYIGGSAFWNCVNLTEIINKSSINLEENDAQSDILQYAQNVVTDESQSKIVKVREDDLYGYAEYFFYENQLIMCKNFKIGLALPLILDEYDNPINYAVGKYAFAGAVDCYLYIPSAWEGVFDAWAFIDSGLIGIEVNPENSLYSSFAGILLDAQGGTLIACVGNRTEIFIPNGVIGILPEAFKGCSNVNYIEIPSTVMNFDVGVLESTNVQYIRYYGTMQDFKNIMGGYIPDHLFERGLKTIECSDGVITRDSLDTI